MHFMLLHVLGVASPLLMFQHCQVQSCEKSLVHLSASSIAGHVYVHVCVGPLQEDADTAAELMEQN